MARYFKARKSKEIRAFLVANGFSLINSKGDDDIYERQGYQYTVKIPNRDSEEIPDGTMSQICKCIGQCGFTKQQILDWWKNNGYGE